MDVVISLSLSYHYQNHFQHEHSSGSDYTFAAFSLLGFCGPSVSWTNGIFTVLSLSLLKAKLILYSFHILIKFCYCFCKRRFQLWNIFRLKGAKFRSSLEIYFVIDQPRKKYSMKILSGITEIPIFEVSCSSTGCKSSAELMLSCMLSGYISPTY